MRHIIAVIAGLFMLSATTLQASSLERYGKIDTQAVEILVQSGLPVVLADARPPRYDDGQHLPGSVMIPHNSSAREIASLVPNKDAVIICYCSNRRCPMAGQLAENLLKMGYRNVLHYPAGVKGWTQAGKPLK